MNEIPATNVDFSSPAGLAIRDEFIHKLQAESVYGIIDFTTVKFRRESTFLWPARQEQVFERLRDKFETYFIIEMRTDGQPIEWGDGHWEFPKVRWTLINRRGVTTPEHFTFS